jgi:RNA polymerase sigma-70 factor (ECF subfamily)
VHRIAVRMTGSVADADDLTQVVFERAWRALPRFQPNAAKVTTWLHRVTVNACLDHLKSPRRHRRLDHPAPERIDQRRDPEAALAGAEATALVQTALLRLPDKARVVLVLRDIEQRSYAEMRATLRLPVTTLKMRVIRARAALARELSALEETDATR